MLIQMMSAGEQSGKVDEMMNKIADVYEDEVNTTRPSLPNSCSNSTLMSPLRRHPLANAPL